MTKYIKKYFFLIIILIITILTRFYLLDRIPIGISGDELLYAVEAKAIFLTGHDIGGTWNPLSAFIFHYPPNEHQAELPYFIQFLFSSWQHFSLFAIKFPYALMSIGVVILLYAIAKYLFGEKTAIITGFIAAINPWLIVTGRTNYETTPATFFYLLSLLCILKLRGKKIFWSIIPLLLAFYAYIGTKLIFVPFIVLAVSLAFIVNRGKSLKEYTILVAVGFAITILFLFFIRSGENSRMSEILLPNNLVVSTQVNEIRKNTITTPLANIFENKITVYMTYIMNRFFRVFSPQYLFIEGDQFFLPIRQSFFYFIDGVFIILGMLFLFTKNRKISLILVAFVVVGTIPHLLHNTPGDFSAHLVLIFPFLIMLIGYGIGKTTEEVKRVPARVVMTICILVYAVSAMQFGMTYFYQYPLVESGDFHVRLLSRYIKLIQRNNSHIRVYSSNGFDLLKKYVFYTNGLNSKSITALRRIFKNPQEITFENISFSSCNDKLVKLPKSETSIIDAQCNMRFTTPHIQMIRLADAGNLYSVYNDSVCTKYAVNTYPSGITLNDFAVEQLSPARFCGLYFR